ncbi:MAG: pirin family protein [Chloroflexota bacterium]|nr:MAG: pirin family protein [Chloroflexota bacterium]
MSNPRTIKQVIEPNLVIEGAGVLLRRSIAPNRENLFDPFLLFDHFAFNDPIQGPIAGFPMHPHRGIETVTYMLEGSVQHRDNLGNSGLIGSGDVQWMTSGSGIMHEEMPRRSEQGNVFGFQLWVNLPAALKMSQPRYQEVNANTIPTVEKDGTKIRIVAGEVSGVKGPVTEIAANPVYLDVELDQGSSFNYPIPSGHTTVAYVFEGEADFGVNVDGSGQLVNAVHLIEFNDGDSLQVNTTPDSGVRFMLMAGAPFREPIVPYGPFVMNTPEEIQQALHDLRNGTFVKV